MFPPNHFKYFAVCWAGVPHLESIAVEHDFTEAKPVHYLNYGAYSSGAPTYDSSFSSLSKKESDLVLSFYGSQNGLDYIQSLRAFVADSNSTLIDMIDNLANVWTGSKHTEVRVWVVPGHAWSHITWVVFS